MTLLPPSRDDDPASDPRDSLRSYYFTILKRRWIVAAIALATFSAGALATFLTPLQYDASTLILVDWSRINLVDDVVVDDRREGSANLFATQEKILRSRVLARRVAEELRLWEHPLFRRLSRDPTNGIDEAALRRITEQVLSMLRVSHFRNTQLMEVGFATPDPALSAVLADAQVRQYVLFHAQAESDLARGASTFIQEEIEELRREITAKEQLLKDLTAAGDAVGDSPEHDMTIRRLEDLNGALSQAEAERAAAEARYLGLRNVRPSSIAEVQEASTVRDLKNKVSALKQEHARLRARFGEEWPEVRRSQAALDEASQELQAEMLAEAAKVVSRARAAYQEVVERERLLRSSMDSQREQARELQRVRASYAQVKAELDNHREMLAGLLRRRSETDLSADLGERQPVKVRVVEPAEAPERASSPNVVMNLAVAAIVGLILGMGTAFALDYFDGRLSTIEELRRVTPLPCLGTIPRYDAFGDPGSRTPLPAIAAGGTGAPSMLPAMKSPEGEGRRALHERLRFLRGSLLLSTPGNAPKAVLVTSPDQSCGKTFVSYYLSAALAQMNKKVLLIDADLRNPNQHKVFGYRNRLGLTNVLTGQRALRDACILRTHIPNLYLLTAGPKSPSAGDLLGSPEMEEVLRTATEHFDFVVLDSAPLLPVFDTHALTTATDAVILVARAGVTTRHAVKTSVELVDRVSGRITGVVLNDVNLTDLAHHYYHGAYNYEYGH